jgi:hypothetical protein
MATGMDLKGWPEVNDEQVCSLLAIVFDSFSGGGLQLAF